MPFTNSNGARISPIDIKPEMRIKTMADGDVEKIHQATLTVLEQTGVMFPSEKALHIFAEGGANVDFKQQIVRIPPDLLMAHLAKAPGKFVMGSRGDEDLDTILNGTRIHCGTAGTGTTTVDLETRQRRASIKNDIAITATIADYLPSISFYWPMVAAQDCPAETIPLHEIEAAFGNTEKHIQIISCTNRNTARYAVEMAAVIAGNSRRMRNRPPLSLIASPISPLSQDEGTLDAAFVFAEAGLPVGFATMPIMGSTAPASVAGAMVLGNAEILSAICLIQLAYPGAPVIYPLFSGMMNPFSGACSVSTDNQYLFYGGTVQLGHYYNLPVMSTFGGSDCSNPGDWQVGRDDSIDAFYICATGPDMLPCLGALEAYTLFYPEKLLFDDEIHQALLQMASGVRVDSETLALDEIMAVGPGGHFLDRDYTIESFRKLWHPGISNQWSAEDQGFRDPQEAALEKTRWILNNHKPKPIGEKSTDELKRIIKTAEDELVK